ncbi:helix-turn-helix transcriptional regulator [Deinococcus koreensis]|uniref:DNA-binding response regulator n=1 Tax=Deinococcus koreensis TaxID=2054903 RepID=A0A2K3V1Q1_9DEIO|nr:response regulator transcription factor [Deinococcus koreensis]PNY82703.1 DNA-binding response regulator [Deinococcus koreensis]
MSRPTVALPASGLPSTPRPTVRVAVGPALLAAGITALLTSAGFDLSDDADVLVIDDSWLPELEALAGMPALVALGAAAWATVLPEIAGGGWAALPADATAAELIAGVLGAAAGLAVLPPAQVSSPGLAASELTPSGLTPAELADDEALGLGAREVSLTPRERDVLALLVEGLSNKRVARDLGVSESTVKFHVGALYSKLGVQSRAGAVARGIQLGLVSV